MQRYEFKVIPAPRRGEKARGVKTTEERFALALTTLMNRMGAEGWDYVRADALPVDERVGLTGTKTTYQNMLVFRRAVGLAEAAVPPAAPEPAVPFFRMAPAEPPAPPMPMPMPPLRLGAADAPAGAAPALGPAKPGLAAE